MDKYTPEQCKRVLLRQIAERGLEDVLNELSAILAVYLNLKYQARAIIEPPGES